MAERVSGMDSLKGLFNQPVADTGRSPSELRLAVAVVLLAAARIEGSSLPVEEAKLKQLFCGRLGLSQKEATSLLALAADSQRGEDLATAVSELRESFSAESRLQVLALIWAVLASDESIAFEEGTFAADVRVRLGLSLEQAAHARKLADEISVEGFKELVENSRDVVTATLAWQTAPVAPGEELGLRHPVELERTGVRSESPGPLPLGKTRRPIIIGVMGPGETARPEWLTAAQELGYLLASQGWIVLSGGRSAGVMDAVCKGAKEGGGITIGVLPSAALESVSPAVDIPIVTDMGSARNNINVLTSRVVVACGMGAGTASEVALALKAKKRVILLHSGIEAEAFYTSLAPSLVKVASTPSETLELIQAIVDSPS